MNCEKFIFLLKLCHFCIIFRKLHSICVTKFRTYGLVYKALTRYNNMLVEDQH